MKLQKGQIITRPDFEIISEVTTPCQGELTDCIVYEKYGAGICKGCYDLNSYNVLAVGYGLKLYRLKFPDKNNLQDFQIQTLNYDGEQTVNLIKDVIEEDVRRMCQDSLAIKWYYNERQADSIEYELEDVRNCINDGDFIGCKPIYKENYKPYLEKIMENLIVTIDVEREERQVK